MADPTPPASPPQNATLMLVTQLTQIVLLVLSLVQASRSNNNSVDARQNAAAALSLTSAVDDRTYETAKKVDRIHTDVEQVKKSTAANPNAKD